MAVGSCKTGFYRSKPTPQPLVIRRISIELKEQWKLVILNITFCSRGPQLHIDRYRRVQQGTVAVCLLFPCAFWRYMRYSCHCMHKKNLSSGALWSLLHSHNCQKQNDHCLWGKKNNWSCGNRWSVMTSKKGSFGGEWRKNDTNKHPVQVNLDSQLEQSSSCQELRGSHGRYP